VGSYHPTLVARVGGAGWSAYTCLEQKGGGRPSQPPVGCLSPYSRMRVAAFAAATAWGSHQDLNGLRFLSWHSTPYLPFSNVGACGGRSAHCCFVEPTFTFLPSPPPCLHRYGLALRHAGMERHLPLALLLAPPTYTTPTPYLHACLHFAYYHCYPFSLHTHAPDWTLVLPHTLPAPHRRGGNGIVGRIAAPCFQHLVPLLRLRAWR